MSQVEVDTECCTEAAAAGQLSFENQGHITS